jgi:hypothetical protein
MLSQLLLNFRDGLIGMCRIWDEALAGGIHVQVELSKDSLADQHLTYCCVWRRFRPRCQGFASDASIQALNWTVEMEELL